eukprot:g34554.t1
MQDDDHIWKASSKDVIAGQSLRHTSTAKTQKKPCFVFAFAQVFVSEFRDFKTTPSSDLTNGSGTSWDHKTCDALGHILCYNCVARAMVMWGRHKQHLPLV